MKYLSESGLLEKFQGCTPAIVYLVIVGIMLLAGVILAIMRGHFSVSQLLSQICSILLCTALIVGTCQLTGSMTLGWIFIVLMILSMGSTLFNVNSGSMMTTNTV